MPLTGHKGFTLSEETEAALPCAFAFLRHLSPLLPPAQPHFSFSGEDSICLSERKRAVQGSWPTACSARIQVLLLLAKRHTQFSHTFFHPYKVHRRFLRDVLPAWGGNTQLLPSGSPPLPAGRGAERYSSLYRTDRTSTSQFLSPDTPPDLSLPSPQPLQKPLWPYRCPSSGRQALQSWYC